MSYEVSIVRCRTYEDARIAAAVVEALQPFGGMSRFVKSGQRVLIKLNLLSAHPPEKAVTTHPALVRAVVRMVQQLGATAIIGDSPGGVNTEASYRALLEKTGMQQVIDETGCEVVNFDESVTTVNSPRARLFKTFTAVTAPDEADVVICLPKLKTHQFAYYTGAVKLLYGYLPGLTKVEYHLHAGKDVMNFAELLLDIYETFPPALCIMDAIVGMEGNGPAHGVPREVGLLLAGTSGTALDYVMCEIIGLPPLQVPTARAAVKRGIGPQSLDEIVMHGEAVDDVRLHDFQQAENIRIGAVPSWSVELGSWLFATRPVVEANKCRHCGKCVESCPPKAITMEKGRLPIIDHAPCLRCYCCQELCPHGAIRVAPPRMRISGSVINNIGRIQRIFRRR